MPQPLLIIALLLITLGIFVGIPVYLNETGRISRDELLTWFVVELCLLALAHFVLSILLMV